MNSRIKWDEVGQHFYETGVKKGVLYVQENGAYPKGVPWNGLTSVTESPSGAEPTALYADDIKYLNLMSAEEFGATVEAYTYPDEFDLCNGKGSLGDGITIGQQERKTFAFSYSTILGNDTVKNDYGYKIHIIYNGTASPSEEAFSSVNDSPEATTFSWEVSTIPVPVKGGKPTASLTITSTKVPKAFLSAIEAILYGADTTAFSTSSTYAVGDIVTYTDSTGETPVTKVYVCVSDITEAGTFDSSDWVEIDVGQARCPFPDEIADLFKSIEDATTETTVTEPAVTEPANAEPSNP